MLVRHRNHAETHIIILALLSFLKGITGLGFSTTCLAKMSLYLDPLTALPLVTLPSIFIDLIVLSLVVRP